MMIVISLILALFVAAVIAFIWTGVRGALGHYDPARPKPEPRADLEATEVAA
jgi:hypothetical protein